MSFGFDRLLADPDRTLKPAIWFQQTGPNAAKRSFFLAGIIFFSLVTYALLALPLFALQDEPISTTATRLEVSGSRLLSTESFGFDIPTAQIQPTDLINVSTIDEAGRSIIAKVHVKVGDNFVVLLPNGRLTSRLSSQIESTDKEFKPVQQKEIAKAILDNELARFSKMKFERSKHYVYLYNTSTGFKDATQRILESMFNGVKAYTGNMGIDTHNPEVPLVVIMFRTQVEFQAYRDMPAGILAYYDMISNHIVLCEESPLANIRPDLAQGQLLSTIAHEGAHQILHNIGVQQRLSMWPMWLSEGIAEFFAPTSFGNRNKWKGAGDVNDLRMFELESFLQTRFLDGFDGRTIREAVTAGRLDSTGYATAWSIVHFLAKKKRKKFNEFVAQMSHLPPMRGMVERPGEPVMANLEHFLAFFGDDTEKIETDMVEYLGNLNYVSPVGHFVHYVGMAIVPDGNGTKRYACFFHTQEKVDDWKTVLVGKLTADQIRNTQWEVQNVNNRTEANRLIRQFIR